VFGYLGMAYAMGPRIGGIGFRWCGAPHVPVGMFRPGDAGFYFARHHVIAGFETGRERFFSLDRPRCGRAPSIEFQDPDACGPIGLHLPVLRLGGVQPAVVLANAGRRPAGAATDTYTCSWPHFPLRAVARVRVFVHLFAAGTIGSAKCPGYHVFGNDSASCKAKIKAERQGKRGSEEMPWFHLGGVRTEVGSERLAQRSINPVERRDGRYG